MHVSTKNLVDTSIGEPMMAFKVPWPDAYAPPAIHGSTSAAEKTASAAWPRRSKSAADSPSMGLMRPGGSVNAETLEDCSTVDGSGS